MVSIVSAISLVGCVVTGSDVSEQMTRQEMGCDCTAVKPAVVPADSHREGRRGGAINIRIQREPASLVSLNEGDPIVSNIIDHTVLETLVRLSDDGKAVEPELAERFVIDNDGNEVAFYLDEAAYWHDGRPVTASDVHFVFSKLLDPYSNLTVNAAFESVKAVNTPDESTVVFELDRYVPGFLEAVATVPILPAHVFGRTPIPLHEASRAPIGSGPFRFVRWVPSRLIELERNPEWRGPAPSIDQIVYHVVPDNRIALDMLKTGGLDIVADLPVGARPPEESDVIRLTYPLPFIEAWVYNMRRPVLAEPASRHAVAMLIDKVSLRCAVMGCLADLPDELLRESSEQEAIFPTMPYDPDGARRLLKESGWSDTNRDGILDRDGIPFSFSLLLPTLGRDQERAAIVIQEELATAGIDMRISTVSRGAFFGRLIAARFDVAALSVRFSGQFDTRSLFHTPQGVTGNFGGFSNPDVDEMLDALQSERDVSVRRDLIERIGRRLSSLQPMTFTFRPHASALYREGIGGVRFHHGWLNASALTKAQVTP